MWEIGTMSSMTRNGIEARQGQPAQPEAQPLPDTSRRAFLRSAARNGISVPVGFMLLGGVAQVAHGGEPERSAALPAPPHRVNPAPTATLIRDFADPYLELVRLLREAAEIEHALM